MDFILATFLREHKDHGMWWYRIKIVPKALSITNNHALLPVDECPGVFGFSKLLGISMNDLWEVLIDCNLAKKKGKGGTIIDKDAIKKFRNTHGHDETVEYNESRKLPVLRIGSYTLTHKDVDHNALLQSKYGKRPPRPLRHVSKKFR